MFSPSQELGFFRSWLVPPIRVPMLRSPRNHPIAVFLAGSGMTGHAPKVLDITANLKTSSSRLQIGDEHVRVIRSGVGEEITKAAGYRDE